MQSVLSIIYPAQCISCGAFVVSDGGLCPDCWKDLAFVRGAACVKCGAPLLGDAPGDDAAECDDCLLVRRPWGRGHAVATYDGVARRLVMGLKHGDRQDLAKPMAGWMAARAPAPVPGDLVVVPVPIHWRRMLSRRFNQSVLLGKGVAKALGATFAPDALIRVRNTARQEDLSNRDRFALQAGSIRPHPGRGAALKGRPVLLVDDVMTSGATLAAATNAAFDAGAAAVDVLTFARVVKAFGKPYMSTDLR